MKKITRSSAFIFGYVFNNLPGQLFFLTLLFFFLVGQLLGFGLLKLFQVFFLVYFGFFRHKVLLKMGVMSVACSFTDRQGGAGEVIISCSVLSAASGDKTAS